MDDYILSLEPFQRHIFINLLINPQHELGGAYKMSSSFLAYITGYENVQVIETLNKFQEDGKIIFRDGWIILKSYFKHNNIAGNYAKGVISNVSNAPEWVQQEVFQNLVDSGDIADEFYRQEWFIERSGNDSQGLSNVSKRSTNSSQRSINSSKHSTNVGINRNRNRNRNRNGNRNGKEEIEKEREREEGADAPTQHTRFSSSEPLRKNSSKSKQPSKAKTPQTFDDVVEELANDETYKGIAVRTEAQKAKQWIKGHPGRKLTKQFFIRWLNRCDREFDINDDQMHQSNPYGVYSPEDSGSIPYSYVPFAVEIELAVITNGTQGTPSLTMPELYQRKKAIFIETWGDRGKEDIEAFEKTDEYRERFCEN